MKIGRGRGSLESTSPTTKTKMTKVFELTSAIKIEAELNLSCEVVAWAHWALESHPTEGWIATSSYQSRAQCHRSIRAWDSSAGSVSNFKYWIMFFFFFPQFELERERWVNVLRLLWVTAIIGTINWYDKDNDKAFWLMSESGSWLRILATRIWAVGTWSWLACEGFQSNFNFIL